MYEALRALEHAAKTARRANALPYSRRETQRVLRRPPFGVELDAKRISTWMPEDFGSAQSPSRDSADKIWALVRLWSDWAGQRADERYWRDLIELAHAERAGPKPQSGAGKPIAEWTDPFDLEVHRAIEATPTPDGTPAPLLPPYISREHDARLSESVQAAVDARSTIAMLVGGSSTGKTRACWEAVRTLPRGWRLWHPIAPNGPQSLLEGIARVGARTVIWLNEAQNYLLTPGSDLGEHAAAALRELLRDDARRPVLVLGTLWSRYWHALADPHDGHVDAHVAARTLLTGSQILVPDSFDAASLTLLRTAANDDRRLAHAAAHAEDGMITQYLAGGPALIERYRTALPADRAVIEAAMDARRLGAGPDLPIGLLEAAAPAYMTAVAWDLLEENWLEQSLTYATSPLRGARGPLTPVRPRPGTAAPPTTSYRLADYLEQHGRAQRKAAPVPAAFWEAALAHADAAGLRAIGTAARDRGFSRMACRLFLAAAKAGDDNALALIGDVLRVADRVDEALEWYRLASEHGATAALRSAAMMLNDAGRADEALIWYERCAEAGDVHAPALAAAILGGMGRIDEALDWYRRGAERDESIFYLAADMLMEGGRTDDALVWLQEHARAGQPRAIELAAVLMAGATDAEAAIEWLRELADSGTAHVARSLADMLDRTERTDEAVRWYVRAADEGDTFASKDAGDVLHRARRTEEALGHYQRAAKEGVYDAWRAAAQAMRDAGQSARAERWLRDQAEAGEFGAMRTAALMMQESGQVEEALAWLAARSEAGDAGALTISAEVLRRAGRIDEALAQYERSLARGGGAYLYGTVAGMLRAAGRVDDALTWYERAIEAGDLVYVQIAVTALKDAGLPARAVEWLRGQAEMGTPGAFESLRRFQRQLGYSEDQQALAAYGWETDRTVAREWRITTDGLKTARA